MKAMIYHTKLSMANRGPLAAFSNNGLARPANMMGIKRLETLLLIWFD